MSKFLERVLVWAERILPRDKSIWISDLRSEANHIPGALSRWWFLCSGTLAALGQVLRFRVGVQRVGQTLLGAALFIFCLGGIYIAPSIENDVVRISFYCVLPIYALMGGLAILSLNWMRRFAICCIVVLALFWVISGLDIFTSMDAPVYFFRAFAVEVALIITGLFIAASYLGWAEDGDLA